jgi:hypothetical protein
VKDDRKKIFECSAWVQCYKPFYVCKLRMFVKAGVFVPGKPFQPSLMFVDKASSLPKSEASFRCSSWGSSGPNQEHENSLGRLAGYKHSSLLRTFVN